MRKKQHNITKDDIKKIIEAWETKTTVQIAEEIDVTTSTIYNIRKQLEANGIKLAKKKRVGYLGNLVAEFAKEYKAKK